MKKFVFKSISGFLITLLVILFTGCDEINDDEPTPETGIGDTLWTHIPPQLQQTIYVRELPLAVGVDGTIYYIADGGSATWEPARVFAINKSDGSLKWQTEPLETWHPNSNIVVADDGTIYVMSYTKLYSIDPGSGSFNWVWEVPERLPHPDEPNGVYSYGEVSSLALANNGDLIFKTSGSGVYYRALYCVGIDGVRKWFRFIQASGNPITVGNNGLIYDYSGENNITYIMATDPSSGNVLWRTRAYVGHNAANIAITEGGDLIAFASADSLFRINYNDGSIVWKTKVNRSVTHRILIDDNGIVNLYATNDWGVYRYSSENGTQIGQVIKNGLYLFDGNGKMYDASVNGVKVYDYDGTDDWSYGVASSGVTLTLSSGKVVYVYGSGKIYAIQGDGSLNSTAWLTYTHDNRNTNNKNKSSN